MGAASCARAPTSRCASRRSERRSEPALKHIARKRFGQHFLTDARCSTRSSRAIDPRPGERAGRDRPRPRRDDRCRWSSAAAADRDRARPRPGGAPAPAARNCDVDRGRRAEGRLRRAGRGGAAQPLRVVGNLPYNISTPILFHLLDARRRTCDDQHFMLQKEVVDRMAAAPGEQGLRPPDGDAAVALRHRIAARRAARGLRPAAARRVGGGAHAAAGREPRAVDAGAARRAGRGGVLAASQAAAQHARPLARRSAASAARSTCSGAPKKCRCAEYLALARALGSRSLTRAERKERPGGRSFDVSVAATCRLTRRSATSRCRTRCSSSACSCRSWRSPRSCAAPWSPASPRLFWAISVARSHDPFSWERATEKNRNT